MNISVENKQDVISIRDQMVRDNLGLIYMVLKRFSGRGYDMDDLFQIGAIGLLKAADRFDVRRQCAFSTYAVPLIIGEIRRFLRDDGSIHIGRKIKENRNKIYRYQKECLIKGLPNPTFEDISNETGLDREEIEEALSIVDFVGSIDDRAGGGNGDSEGMTFVETLKDDTISEEKMIDKIMLYDMIGNLERVERQLVQLRYLEGKTQKEVGRKLEMSQVAVSRLEKKIIHKLRKQYL